MKHIVGFSGGIDSQACARWVLNRFPAEDVLLLNSNAGGNEHPLTTEFIASYSANIFPVQLVIPLAKDITDHPGAMAKHGIKPDDLLLFPMLAKIYNRFPSKMAQFCTESLKIRPILRWIKEHLSENEEYCRYAGVRRDESKKRENTPFEAWDDLFDCNVFHPLADWTKQMCFDYVRQYNEPVNHLYSLGFERVGCAPCVNSRKDDVRNWADRFPAMIDKVRAWEHETSKTFFPPMIPRMDHPFNWVDEVVAWSRTDRGGFQFNILKTLEREPCESKYGLCE